MNSDHWHYRKKEEEFGSFNLEEMRKKIDEGEINDETFVRHSQDPDWKQVKEIKELNIEFLDTTPPITKPELEEHNLKSEEREKKWTRPFIRFFARMMDYSLFYLLLWCFAYFFNQPLFLLHPLFFLTIITFIFVFIEALFFSIIGTTPGKWFLKTTVRKENGKKPSYREALARALSVWGLGFGGGLPIICIITGIVANIKLSNTGLTTWDRHYQFSVTHKRLGFFRTFLTVLYFIFFIALLNGDLNIWSRLAIGTSL
ncbi:MAG: RDD family protein [Simkaniaceae bacterium]